MHGEPVEKRRKAAAGTKREFACEVRLIGLALEAQKPVVGDAAVQVTADALTAAAWTSE